VSALALVFSLATFFSTLLGGMAALRLRNRLQPVMAFAAGVLVATALADLLPEAAEQAGENAPIPVGMIAVGGFLLFAALDAFLHRQAFAHLDHHHDDDADHVHDGHAEEHDAGALGFVGPAGLIVHSTLDGLAIGLGFRASAEVGLLVALAVLAHDFADGMNVVTLAAAGGRSRASTLAFLGADALAPVIGAVVGSFASVSGSVLGALLALFAGVFIAIGAGHLLPEAQMHKPGLAPALVGLAALGALVVLLVRSVLG
jgi:ZIP family zinc transporter